MARPWRGRRAGRFGDRDPEIEGHRAALWPPLRPGNLGPTPSGRTSVHVDAAAHAAFLAVSRGIAGVYNIADDDGSVSIAKARRELGWNPEFRLPPAPQ